MTATWLADALRLAGCSVDESLVPDWKARGHTDGPSLPRVVGVIGHHTAGATTGDLPSLRIVRDGRPDLAGPLANLMLSRAGVWVPIAAGRAWHAGNADTPSRWPWVPNGDANGYMLGIEAESAGTGDWTPAQLDAYPRGVAALLGHLGLGADRFIGHKEWAPTRKVDPRGWPGDLGAFRTTIAAHLTGDDMPLTQTDYDNIAAAVVNRQVSGARTVWQVLAGLDSRDPKLNPVSQAVVDRAIADSDTPGGAPVALWQVLRGLHASSASQAGQIAGLQGALQQLAASPASTIDLDAVFKAAQDGARSVTDNLRIVAGTGAD